MDSKGLDTQNAMRICNDITANLHAVCQLNAMQMKTLCKKYIYTVNKVNNIFIKLLGFKNRAPKS